MTVLRYSIIRYVPDPLREEHMNIGVVVAADDATYADVRFLNTWKRAQRFSQHDVAFLRDFAQDFELDVARQPDLFGGRGFTSERLQHYASNWYNAIQFSEPRASVASNPRALLNRLYTQYVEPESGKMRRARDKRAVVRLALTELSSALANLIPLHTPDVLKNETIVGLKDLHNLDLVIRNGRPLFGVEGLSFAKPPSGELENEVNAAAWHIGDILAASSDFPIGVVVIPPARSREDYTNAVNLYRKMGAEVVEEPEVPAWASATARRVAEAMP